MKYCSKCGTGNSDEVNFCTKCGNSIDNVEIKPENADAAQEAASNVPAPAVHEAVPDVSEANAKIKAPKLGIAALVLSIIGFVTAFTGVGLVLDVIAIVLGIIALVQMKKKPAKKGMPIAGIVVAACSLVLCSGFIWDSVASMLNIGRSEATVIADNLISEIGEVTLDNEIEIKQAESAVEALDEDEKKKLRNGKKLEKARAEYTELQAEEIENKIAAIGEVTLDREQAVSDARSAFNGSSDEVRKLVDNFSVLDDAEKTLSGLRVKQVEDIISKIGGVTLDSENSINEAQAAYDKLLDADKTKVSNMDALNSAKTKLNELKQEQKKQTIDSLMDRFTVENDKVQGATFYKPDCMPEYADTRCYILPYIGKNDNSVWLRMDYHYTGDSWVFFKNIKILVDGQNYSKSFNYFDINHDNEAGKVWEWIDTDVSNADIEMLKAIANSNETIVRYEGDAYRYDLTVTSGDKQGIKDVLTVYEAMK